MRKSTQNRAIKSLLLAGGASMAFVANPAFAQDEEGVESGESTPIIVTGSRIVRQDFESNSPIVTVDESFLQNSSTAALEQNLNRLPQFVPAQTPTAGGDIQPTATNTPGAATVSLRGIGSNRNLVLIDGRRATPSNASGVVDISTIPSAAVERVEIISGGASATYGADAVAGVTNFILKRNFEGLELDAQVGLTEHGDGFEYQISGIMGADFDDGRGNVSIAMSTNVREASYQRDRDYYRDLWADTSVGGTQFFIDRPGINFGFGNLPDFSTVFGTLPVPAAGTTVYANRDGSGFTSAFGSGATGNFNSGPTDGFPYKRTDVDTIVQNNIDSLLVLPLTRYNVFARGNYEINDWIGVFAQGMFTHVNTFTRNEPGPIFAGWGVSIDPTGLDADQLPQDFWDLLNSRPDPAAPFTLTALLPEPRTTDTDVSTYNLTAGLEGYVPGTDWTWEAFVSHGESETFAIQRGVYSLERTRAVLNSGNFGEGFVGTGNAAFGGFGASTATCTSGLNFFNPPAGGFSEDCLQAIRADLKNRSTMRQTIVEANFQGGLVDLPAGQVRAAVGASYREQDYQYIKDTLTTQGSSFLDQALGIYPSGNAQGHVKAKEVYGELLIPILSDIPGIQQLNLELGGRMSDYNTTGTSYTYKVLGDWEVTDWLRIRGGFNRAERAPNIGELFLAAQQTFAGNSAGDPCAINNPLSFSANPGTNSNAANVEAICRTLMDQSGDPTADDFFYLQDPVTGNYLNGANNPVAGGAAFPTTVGNPNLTPETADTWTVGFVIQSPSSAPLLANMRLSVDWFNIKVDNAIGEQTVAAALQQCFDPALNPLAATDAAAAANTQACQFVPRNAQNGGLGNVQRTYTNNGRFGVQGIDGQLDWAIDAGPGRVNLNVLVNYLLHFKSAALPVLPLVDYVGTTGTNENGLNFGPYEYRVLTTLGYSMDSWSLGVQWQHLPSIEDGAEAMFGPTPTTGAPAYNIFHLNGTYSVTENVNLRFGVENLFDRAPPRTNVNTAANPAAGQLPGGSLGSVVPSPQIYDTIGRRFYLGANLKF